MVQIAYSTPLTAVANAPLTASQWNASVRDNMLVTPAALATGGSWPADFRDAGLNTIARRETKDNDVESTDTTGSTGFTATLTSNSGPAVTITTGGFAMVFLNASQSTNGTGFSIVSFAISGATSSAATDNRGLTNDIGAANRGIRGAVTSLATLTSGSNIFTANYRVESGTGSFLRRRLQIMAL